MNDFLSGSGQDAIDARQYVRTLVIDDVTCASDNWPNLPTLQGLTIQVNNGSRAKYSCVLCISALPTLQRLTIAD